MGDDFRQVLMLQKMRIFNRLRIQTFSRYVGLYRLAWLCFSSFTLPVGSEVLLRRLNAYPDALRGEVVLWCFHL